MEHPLSQFKYCPKCGSAHFEVHNEKSKQCADCGFVYYFNPSSATVALILNERDELLVCRRAKEPAKGTLDLPALQGDGRRGRPLLPPLERYPYGRVRARLHPQRSGYLPGRHVEEQKRMIIRSYYGIYPKKAKQV